MKFEHGNIDMLKVRTSDFDYHLPTSLIAQTPAEPRDHSRLLVLSREERAWEHRRFFEIIDYLREGDLLVCNNSRVLPARLIGRREDTGGKLEILLLRRVEEGVWETLARPGRRARVGTRVVIRAGEEDGGGEAHAEVLSRGEAGTWLLRFDGEAALMGLGQVPLPPYIRIPLADPERYQTVYARPPGSVAAPTAGLHFTPELLESIKEKGVSLRFVTLHVGLDTFRPVQEEDPSEHHLHQEYGEVSEEVAGEVRRAKEEGRRVIAVGTTSVRLLEEAGREGEVHTFRGWTGLFILPGYCFKVVDALITNFHLPRSTLLMLVSAFAGRELALRTYQEAIQQEYRFYSFGDAMLIL